MSERVDKWLSARLNPWVEFLCKSEQLDAFEFWERFAIEKRIQDFGLPFLIQLSPRSSLFIGSDTAILHLLFSIFPQGMNKTDYTITDPLTSSNPLNNIWVNITGNWLGTVMNKFILISIFFGSLLFSVYYQLLQ